MNTLKLIFLRLFNVTLGRLAFFSKILRFILVKILIKERKDKYVPSSRYFDINDLNNK